MSPVRLDRVWDCLEQAGHPAAQTVAGTIVAAWPELTMRLEAHQKAPQDPGSLIDRLVDPEGVLPRPMADRAFQAIATLLLDAGRGPTPDVHDERRDYGRLAQMLQRKTPDTHGKLR